MLKLDEAAAAELASQRQFVAAVNQLASITPDVWNECRAWVDALQTVPGSQLELADDGMLFVLRPDGERIPAISLVEFVAASMGEPESAARN